MVRLNITLPDDLAKDLKKVNNKSKFIADTLRDRFKKDKKQSMLKQLKEAYQKSAQEDQVVVKDWDNTSGDGER